MEKTVFLSIHKDAVNNNNRLLKLMDVKIYKMPHLNFE